MKLPHDLTDDSAFVRLMERLVSDVVSANQLGSFYVIKIDNWFGPKWLGFCHTLLGAVGVASRDPTAPALVPPFKPSRVLSTCRYERERGTVHNSSSATLHRDQSSEENVWRTLERVMPNDGAFWWSGASGETSKGSIMAYLPAEEGHVGWYVSYNRTTERAHAGDVTSWLPAQLRGITRRELEAFAGRQKA